MVAVEGYIILILAFIDGLFFGLAIKKGISSFVLLIIAIFIAGYAGFAFLPKLSFSAILSHVKSFIFANIDKLPSILPIGKIGSLSIILVLFLIGLGIGIWKG